MIKKLKIKFVLINMLIVIFMIGIIFFIFYYSTSNQLEHESVSMMRNLSMKPINLNHPREEGFKINLPYFSVFIDDYGNIDEIVGNYYDLSDPSLVDDIVEQAQRSGHETGLIPEYNLRYLRMVSPDGGSIVFADTTSEQVVLKSMTKTFFIISGIGFFLFLIISVLYSNWAVKPVEAAWKQQKQFVADASHELKTPLTVIMTNAELLSSPECTDSEHKTLSNNIITMSHQMSGLVENMLELARIDNGTVKGSMVSTSFSDTASEASMIFEPVFFEKGLNFTYDIASDIKLTGNQSQLKQLVDILLDNALKYASPSADVKLSLSKTSSKKCLLCVSNQGEKIDDEDLKNLFKRFYRADKARTLNHSYGLGLSIAQSICEEHRGSIWVESKDGYNSFYAELPCNS